MQLKIYNNYSDGYFINFVPYILKVKWNSDRMNYKYVKMDKYLTKLFGQPTYTYDILVYALNHSYVTITKQYYLLDLSSNARYRGHKISELIHLIEFGNLEIKGTYTISKWFKDIINQGYSYYQLYKLRNRMV